jgi:hypothetical protein
VVVLLVAVVLGRTSVRERDGAKAERGDAADGQTARKRRDILIL